MRPARTSIIHFLSRVGVSIIGFIGTLYLSRVLGAGVFGTYVVVLSLIHWLNIPTTAIGTAIAKRVSESREKSEFLGAGFSMNAGIILTIVVIMLLFEGPLTAYVGTSVTFIFLFIVTTHLSFGTVTAGLEGLKKVEYTGFLVFLEQAVRVGLQIVLLVVGFRLSGALFGYGLAFLLVTITGFIFYDVRIARPQLEHAKSLVSYARYSWVGSIKSKVAGPSIDALILNLFVASSFIGVYQVSWNIASILVMASGSIKATLFPEISHLAAEDDYDEVRNLLEQGLVFTGMFAIPGFLGSLLIGPRVLQIYGSEFARGGGILLILIIARSISAYSAQFTSAINGIDRPDLAFRINLVLIASNVFLNLILIPIIGWYGAAIATAVSTALSLVLGYYFLMELIGGISLPVKELSKQFISGIVMMVTISTILPFIPQYNHFATVAIVLFAAGIYGGVLIVTSSYVRNKLISVSPV